MERLSNFILLQLGLFTLVFTAQGHIEPTQCVTLMAMYIATALYMWFTGQEKAKPKVLDIFYRVTDDGFQVAPLVEKLYGSIALTEALQKIKNSRLAIGETVKDSNFDDLYRAILGVFGVMHKMKVVQAIEKGWDLPRFNNEPVTQAELYADTLCFDPNSAQAQAKPQKVSIIDDITEDDRLMFGDEMCEFLAELGELETTGSPQDQNDPTIEKIYNSFYQEVGLAA